MFSFTILWRRVWVGHPELCTGRQEEDLGGGVVTLNSFDGPAELSRHIGKEIGQSGEGVRFKLQRKSP
jgi:hypothetical protein